MTRLDPKSQSGAVDKQNDAESISPQQQRREESDRKMLRAATKLISLHGTVGASLADIGIEAGYSRGLPAQRFGSKLKLLEAVIDAIEDKFLKDVEQRTKDMPCCEALAERIRMQIMNVHDRPESAIALYHLIVDSFGMVPGLKPRIQQLMQTYRTNIRGFLDQAQEMGELRDGLYLDEIVRTISGTISGICIQALAGGDTARLKKDANFIADLFVSQVRKPELSEITQSISGEKPSGAGGD